MIARTLWAGALLLCVGAGLSACATAGGEPPPILSKQSPVALRAMQIRAFDTPSKRRMTQAVIAALQDLGYTVEHIDYASGTISAAKLDALRLTVVIYPHGATQMSVRANAIVKLAAASTQVDDPAFYQKLFFEPLSRAVFLAALQTEDDATAPAPPLPPALPSAGKPPLKS
ncbi:MAG: hypothetical protein QOF70_655 [Acetobacteraceae bacterium]|nr:hypothetical protein [Acetobacteraceae bacterium]